MSMSVPMSIGMRTEMGIGDCRGRRCSARPAAHYFASPKSSTRRPQGSVAPGAWNPMKNVGSGTEIPKTISIFATMFATSQYLSLKCTAIKCHQRIEQDDCYGPKHNLWRLLTMKSLIAAA
ncbi:MAG: hypothetical protein V4793_04640, partial [Paraburkholderia tropica]